MSDDATQPRAASDRPIGVFDSGVGGLTVLRALRRRLPREHFLYLGDTARVPYGTKSIASVTRYAAQAARALVQREIKLLVIACNTASAVALEALAAEHPSIPVMGVIGPGAEAACKLSTSGRIAVIATESTVRGGAYQDAIRAQRPSARITARACSLFVALAEEGWVDGPLVEGIAARYLKQDFGSPDRERPDVLVLGCTHFPVLAPAIGNVVGRDVTLVDSAATTAVAVQELLASSSLLRAGTRGEVHFLATDGADRFRRVGERFFGEQIDLGSIELVDL